LGIEQVRGGEQVSEWNSMQCPNCGNDEAIHTIWSEGDHEINCQECDLIERDSQDNCAECATEGESK
jgi:ribosomal protein S27E